MVWFVKLMGIAIVALGAIYIVKPAIMKKYIKFWVVRKRIYFGGALSILIGIIFIFSALKCTVGWFVILMGIVSIIKGIILFVWGPKKSAEYVDKIIHSSGKTLRNLSIAALALGAALIFAA